MTVRITIEVEFPDEEGTGETAKLAPAPKAPSDPVAIARKVRETEAKLAIVERESQARLSQEAAASKVSPSVEALRPLLVVRLPTDFVGEFHRRILDDAFFGRGLLVGFDPSHPGGDIYLYSIDGHPDFLGCLAKVVEILGSLGVAGCLDPSLFGPKRDEGVPVLFGVVVGNDDI